MIFKRRKSELDARQSLSRLAAAAREVSEAIDGDHRIPVAEVIEGVPAALVALYPVFANYDASVLRARVDAQFEYDPEQAGALNDALDMLEVNLEALLGRRLPQMPGPDGTGRALARSQRSLFGQWSGRRPS